MNQIQRLEEFVSRMTPEQYARLLEFAASLLDKGSLQSEREVAPQSAESAEAELLQRIQHGLPENLRQRLHELTLKSEAEILSDAERAEYIVLAEQREASDAERMQAVCQLLRQLVSERARGCCEYCRSQEAYATERFSIEHIQPRASGGLTIAENLALACQGCNGHKATKTAATDPETNTMTLLFHPRRHIWQEHFAWGEDQLRLVGLTPIGRATIGLLQMNRPSLVNLRRAIGDQRASATR